MKRLSRFTTGPHKVLIELVNANHQPLDKVVITFTIPSATQPGSHH